MLKTTRSLNKPVFRKNDGSKLASGKNNNSQPAFGRNDGDNEVNGFGISRNGVEQAKKLRKSSKSKKSSKSEKLKAKKCLSLEIWLN